MFKYAQDRDRLVPDRRRDPYSFYSIKHNPLNHQCVGPSDCNESVSTYLYLNYTSQIYWNKYIHLDSVSIESNRFTLCTKRIRILWVQLLWYASLKYCIIVLIRRSRGIDFRYSSLDSLALDRSNLFQKIYSKTINYQNIRKTIWGKCLNVFCKFYLIKML